MGRTIGFLLLASFLGMWGAAVAPLPFTLPGILAGVILAWLITGIPSAMTRWLSSPGGQPLPSREGPPANIWRWLCHGGKSAL